MELQVGDIVRIGQIPEDKQEGPVWVPEMDCYAGALVEVTGIGQWATVKLVGGVDEDDIAYHYREDIRNYTWLPKWFEPNDGIIYIELND